MSKNESGETRQARLGWIVAAAIGLVSVVGAAATALGIITPAERLKKVETAISEHETRIQKLEDMDEAIKSIADAVGADLPKKKKR